MTKTKKQITEYVKKFCSNYSLDYTAYFYQYDEYDCPIAAPIFGENTIESKLSLLSELFGLSYEEIINCSENGFEKWGNKYPFFKLLRQFEGAQFKSGCSEKFTEEIIANAIFNRDGDWKFTSRYDIENIKSRTIEKLKELNEVMPNTYHEGATLTKFKFETEQLCSFPQITDLIRSLLNMLNNVKRLFFKAIESSLSKEEELEYNFLVTVLGVRDVASRYSLYYKNIILLKSVIKEEGYTDFYSYARLDRLKNLAPWRAKEFVEDKELVQAYINEYPMSYREFSNFVKELGRFNCSFIWSDEPFVKDDVDFQISKEINTPRQEWTNVYLEKTFAEMQGDDAHIFKYERLVGSPKQGGITMPNRELPLFHYRKIDMSRLSKHICALGGKNNG